MCRNCSNMGEVMPKTYDPSSVEDRLYKHWEESGYFHSEPDPGKKPYCIVIPPPNITGQLHMGHALDETLQDVLIRYKRMSGYEAMWLPGTDHASIATEVKIVDQLRREGIDKRELGREGFLERAWAWSTSYRDRIIGQLKKLGSSCDWERERFTMDEGCSRAVRRVFVDLYNEGYIYRGHRIINWCPTCRTALSDAEVEYEEQESHLWHVRYDAPDGSYSIVCATTRPETILGDTGIAVNPNDERYFELVGKTVIVPIVGREIPIVADEYVEMEFGTGAVKITPSHDPNDFEVGQRAGLPQLRVFTDDGRINELGGAYEGLTTLECRQKFVEDLEKCGALVKIEPHTHNVGTCYRCHSTVEPLTSEQWFVSMKELSKPAIEAVENGDIKFIPKRFEKTYLNWMYNIRDWCISRQLWWGHRIPAYYCTECERIVVAEDAPPCCPDCGAPMRQDDDVLDTWFSSGLWPFSTLGFPDNTPELDYYYPTATLVTGYDIIPFWIARMIVFGLKIMKRRPFDTVYVHGLLRDELGRKMSKSLGNGIDPLELIREYGADALRFSLITGNSAGNDMRMYIKKVEAARNFCNKIYNASRFLLMNLSIGPAAVIDVSKLDIADKWILHRLNEVTRAVTDSLNAFDLNLAGEKISDFIWTEFCDWYIEMAKPRLHGEDETIKQNTCAVLIDVLSNAMKLLHPFMPFITEDIYTRLPGSKETIMLSKWPEYRPEYDFAEAAEGMEQVMDMIRAIRNIRAEMNVAPSKRAHLTIIATGEKAGLCIAAAPYFIKLANASEVDVAGERSCADNNSVSVAASLGEALIPMNELIDIEKELERLNKEKQRWTGEVARAEAKLNNPGFVAKAPRKVIDEEGRKLENAKSMLEKISQRIEELSRM